MHIQVRNIPNSGAGKPRRPYLMQGLVALTRLEFYSNKYWKYLSSKADDLKQQIHEKTGLNLALLKNRKRC